MSESPVENNTFGIDNGQPLLTDLTEFNDVRFSDIRVNSLITPNQIPEPNHLEQGEIVWVEMPPPPITQEPIPLSDQELEEEYNDNWEDGDERADDSNLDERVEVPLFYPVSETEAQIISEAISIESIPTKTKIEKKHFRIPGNFKKEASKFLLDNNLEDRQDIYPLLFLINKLQNNLEYIKNHFIELDLELNNGISLDDMDIERTDEDTYNSHYFFKKESNLSLNNTPFFDIYSLQLCNKKNIVGNLIFNYREYFMSNNEMYFIAKDEKGWIFYFNEDIQLIMNCYQAGRLCSILSILIYTNIRIKTFSGVYNYIIPINEAFKIGYNKMSDRREFLENLNSKILNSSLESIYA